jgi:hypothetical protein
MQQRRERPAEYGSYVLRHIQKAMIGGGVGGAVC